MARAPIAWKLLAVALSCSGCHDGDDARPPSAGAPAEVGFRFEVAALWVREGDAPVDLAIELETSLPGLVTEASVEVFDLGTGSALTGLDHAGFEPRRVTFPAGSVDGARQLVQVDPLDDDRVEAAGETIVLGLRRPIGAALLGAPRLTLTVIDADEARVGFAAAAGAAAEGSPAHVAVELDCGPGVILDVPVRAVLADHATGTAEAGDYAAFPAETLTFAAGSADGAVHSARLDLLDDAAPELDETIVLGLTSPSSGILGAIPVHLLTIEDDDLSGEAVFLVTQGPNGIENELDHDDPIDLGREPVGGPPSAGTLVRVANFGGQSMALGAALLSVSHPQDFSIVVEDSSFATARLPVVGGPPVAARPVVLTPILDQPGPGVLHRLWPNETPRTGPGAALAVHGVVLPEVGPVSFELVSRPLPLAADARLTIDGQQIAGGPQALLGDLELLSGSVAGLEGSRVFLARDRAGLQGYVRLPEPFATVVQVVPQGPEHVRFVGDRELLGARLPDALCAGQLLSPRSTPRALDPSPTGSSALTVPTCRLAIETDHPLFVTLGGSSTGVTSYVTSLIAAVSELFAINVPATLAIAYLGIHTTEDDGWDAQETEGASVVDLLYEFQAAWSGPGGWPAEADLAHFLTSARLGGGVAFLDGVCSQEFGFGVSGSLQGRIDWSSWTGQAATFTWDFTVVAHELGHGFGALHTHSYCPPVDECAPPSFWENCQDETRCQRGTIMSYCHLECGGMANIDLEFHPVCANSMRSLLNIGCLESAVLSPGDFVTYRLRFDPETTTGSRRTNLSFIHDAPNARQPFRLRLSGVAE